VSPTQNVVEHRLGPIDQIAVGEGREFTVAGLNIAVFRLRGGGIAATQAQCPHRNGPLADGIVGMNSIVCPLHNWKFALTTGAAEVGDCDITTYPARIDATGDVLIALPQPAESE
jgi:nitrite reductase (NADH) small subunit